MPRTRARAKKPVAESMTAEEVDRALADDGALPIGLLTRREQLNALELSDSAGQRSHLYPSLDDPLFNVKIAEKKEFFDTRYSGEVKDLAEEAERLCNADFELAPHQLFVRNFLSFATPYNSLLLYHGLGSGKTCSAIGVGEEMRDYLKQMGISQRIIVVASPNVQDNFRTQLFDERKLKEVDGLWNIRACTGNRFLKEINPMSMKGLPKDKIVRQVRRIINGSYLFLGYIEFANYINKISTSDGVDAAAVGKRRLARHFSNRLVIIDEVHNIRISDENKDKKVAVELYKLVESVEGIRLLLLSATPMYNTYREVIWLINLMNINDRRPGIEAKQVFDADGSFRVDGDGVEVGRELLERKATGYVSFVRGENPYAFPYRIYPSYFSPSNSLASHGYPALQLNGKPIRRPLEHIGVFVTNAAPYQSIGYTYIVDRLRYAVENGIPPYREMPNFENMDAFGYTMLQRPLEALNIVYPDTRLNEYIAAAGVKKGKRKGRGKGDVGAAGDEAPVDPKELVGKAGLARIGTFKEVNGVKRDFKYKETPYGSVFAPGEIGKYSAKISAITKSIMGSEGIVLVYSQYIEGGLIPIALALEELGLTRYVGRMSKSKNLFAAAPSEPLDFDTMKPRGARVGAGVRTAKYAMITGDKSISPNNLEEINAATGDANADGSVVKVVLISQAGSEGLDFIAIRQVHVLEPWYNMNRIEQIIGRAVRWCSHRKLPFTKRNVEIFLYSTMLEGNDANMEAADLYVYRLAEAKAVQIGAVARVLKKTAVDCLLNLEQVGFTVSDIGQTVKQELSSGKTIQYPVGDKPFTAACDYMENCAYKCRPDADLDEDDVKLDTFSEAFILMNTDKIVQRVRQLMKDRFFYTKEELITSINVVRNYPLVQINAALTQLVDDENEYIIDMYGRPGNLVNKGDLYLFQPLELTDTNVGVRDRSVPIAHKNKTVRIPIVDLGEGRPAKTGENIDIIRKMQTDYEVAMAGSAVEASDGWYDMAAGVVSSMRDEGVDEEKLTFAVVKHMVEVLDLADMLRLIGMPLLQLAGSFSVVGYVMRYLSTLVMKHGDFEGALLYKPDGNVLYVRRGGEGVFSEAEAEDYTDFKGQIQSNRVLATDLSRIVGFMAYFKSEYIVFKTKQMDRKRHKGARCDQSGKSETLRILNGIVAGRHAEYTSTNTRDVGQKELCVRQELTLRVYDSEKVDGKRWFLGPTEAVESDLDKLSFV